VQAIEARRATVAALARQWFGVFMRPRAPADAWLLAGLAGWLEGQFVRTFQGANELAYRRVWTPRSQSWRSELANHAPAGSRGDRPFDWPTGLWQSSLRCLPLVRASDCLSTDVTEYAVARGWAISGACDCGCAGGARSGRRCSRWMTAWRRR
jgi:hypothetical protein